VAVAAHKADHGRRRERGLGGNVRAALDLLRQMLDGSCTAASACDALVAAFVFSLMTTRSRSIASCAGVG
jgi:hypothetical protein